jgi:hypothetical protein
VDELAVSDDGVITASGLGNVEFAREIFRLLKIYDENDLRTWYDMFKRGLMPAAWHRLSPRSQMRLQSPVTPTPSLDITNSGV